MSYPTTYTWPLQGDAATGDFPSTTQQSSGPSFGGSDARKVQFERGVKFANVPGGRADFVVHGGPRVYHVNSLAVIQQLPGDRFDFSGVIRRGSSTSQVRVPAKVRG